MNTRIFHITGIAAVALLLAAPVTAQTAIDNVRIMLAQADEADALKIAALQALMSAPAERALPLVRKALQGQHSDEVKTRALFVLSQIDNDEAQQLLLQFASDDSGKLQHEAVRMIGIGGNADALAQLASIYTSGNREVREAVLHAYLIADEPSLVVAVAQNANTREELDKAVRTLAAMGATDELRQLQDKVGASEGMLQAYAIAGDLESLLQVATGSPDIAERQMAIRSIGIIDAPAAGEALLQIYRDNDEPQLREAALQGLLVHGDDEGVMALYRSSNSLAEKQRLLRTLVIMDSELALELVDTALEGQ